MSVQCKLVGGVVRVVPLALMLGVFASGAPRISFHGLVSPTAAEVGRPLTPVSVAAVARRTTPRRGAGVYNCQAISAAVLRA